MTSPSPPPPPEGLPEEIVKAIEELQWAAEIQGQDTIVGDDERTAIAETHTNVCRIALDTTILHHLSAALAERDERERFWRTYTRARLAIAGHVQRATRAKLSAARARAERAEKALKAALAIGYHIQLNADPYISRCASDANEKIRAALSPTQEP